MSSTTITRKLIAVLAATLLAAGILAWNPAPAAAACNSTEVYVKVLGDRYNSPTNGCLGPSDWGLFACDYGETQVLNHTVVVGTGVCFALPI